MEMVDIVDDKNEVLYSVSKQEAHEKGLLHRTVVGEVRDRQGRIILVRQAADRQDPGQYVSPVGGHVTSGETEDHAFRRETEEEIGLRDFEYKLIGSYIFNRFVKAKNRQENHYFTLYEITCEGHLDLGPEAVSYRAFTEHELKERLRTHREEFGGAYIAVIEHFYKRLLSR